MAILNTKKSWCLLSTNPFLQKTSKHYLTLIQSTLPSFDFTYNFSFEWLCIIEGLIEPLGYQHAAITFQRRSLFVVPELLKNPQFKSVRSNFYFISIFSASFDNLMSCFAFLIHLQVGILATLELLFLPPTSKTSSQSKATTIHKI